jgi:hypothetical protein
MSSERWLKQGGGSGRSREGRGILDLMELNMCLLASWVQRYYDSESKLWREIIDYKYKVEPNIFCCVDRNAPPPPFEKGSYGQLEQLKCILGGNLGMVRGLDFGRTNGLVRVVDI